MRSYYIDIYPSFPEFLTSKYLEKVVIGKQHKKAVIINYCETILPISYRNYIQLYAYF